MDMLQKFHLIQYSINIWPNSQMADAHLLALKNLYSRAKCFFVIGCDLT